MTPPLACQQAAREETFYNGEKKLFGSRMNDLANFSRVFHRVQLVVKWTALYNVQINVWFGFLKTYKRNIALAV